MSPRASPPEAERGATRQGGEAASSKSSLAGLVAFARELGGAGTYGEVLAAAAAEVEKAMGLSHAWLYVAEDERLERVRLIDMAGARRDKAFASAPLLEVKGDKLVEEIVRGDGPVVVVDARTDPRTNKKLVEELGCRTLINVPMRLVDKRAGAFGVGSFGDEGCFVPTGAQLDYLIAMAGQVGVAIGRIRFLEQQSRAEEEKRAADRRFQERQKLEALGLLAAGVAHDFSNLLTVVLASAGAVRRATSPAEVAQYTDAIVEAAEHGRELSRQLLSIGRSAPYQPDSLDLNQRVKQLALLLQRILPETIRVEVALDPSLSPVRADASSFDQVVMNLCIRARDAMPSGGQLTLSTSQRSLDVATLRGAQGIKPGLFAVVTVEDTGGEMSEEAKRVVEPILAGAETEEDAENASGLGLAIAHGIVAQHHGALLCDTIAGVGTRFAVCLPMGTTASPSIPPPGGRASVQRGGGGERILLAEDDPAVRRVVGELLRDSGYEVISVENGRAALAAAGSSRFDLFVLDVIMPEMGGPEAVAAIRQTQPGARFILATGYAGTALNSPTAALDRVTVLEKPYDVDTLLRAVRQTLDAS